MAKENIEWNQTAVWATVAVIAVLVLLWWIFVSPAFEKPSIISPQPDNVNLEVFQETGKVIPATDSATPVISENPTASPSSSL